MNFDRIPQELVDKRQWVCFDIEGDLKIPYTPGTSNRAASNQSSTWRSFRAACRDVEEGKRQYIGYCFSSDDPFVFIDLDDPTDEFQQEVFNHFVTYCQRSIGGQGVHLIGRGTFSGPGRHPKKPAMGVFQQERFCLMTGDVIEGREEIRQFPTRHLQALVDSLGKTPAGHEQVELSSAPRSVADMSIFEMGVDTFPVKFHELTNGNWSRFEEFHGDHSAADHALIAMLCDLTDCDEQVRDLFKMSGMWTSERQQKKAAHGPDGYIDRTIRKIRSKQHYEKGLRESIPLAFVEAEEVPEEKVVIEVVEKKRKKPSEQPQGNTDLIESLPPGLLKEIVEYSFQTSFHPLQEASLCVGMMLLSGLCGRGYLTPTNSGLNLWMVLVGGTSCGKDEYQVGLKRVLKYASTKAPHIRKIFGGEVVSGPGIEESLTKTKRFISYFPEFGDSFRLIANPAAPEHVKTLNRGLLNSFNAAGLGGSIEGRRKAKQEEATVIERPCLCLAGEATPESLYDNMTTRELSTGFLQRFILLDVPQSSWSMKENPQHGEALPKSLLQRVANLAMSMDMTDATDKFIQVGATRAAGSLLGEYRRGKRAEVLTCGNGLVHKELINRAGVKALRVASLLAVSADSDVPVIEEIHAEWAIQFIERTDGSLLQRFNSGDIGAGQVKQESVIRHFFEEERKRALKGKSKSVKLSGGVLHENLKAAVVNHTAFAGDKAGAVSAFERAITQLVSAGSITRVPPAEALAHFGVSKAVLFWNT
jgi:hypothetical protein